MNKLIRKSISIISIIGMIVSMSVFGSGVAEARPKSTVFNSATYNKSKKTVKLKWKRVKKVNGYQIQYSTKKSFKGKKVVKIKNNKTTSKTIKSIKANKKYYFRIRSYKLTKKNGKTTTVYSKFSKVRLVKTTKGSSLPKSQITECYYNAYDETIVISWNAVNGIDGYEIQESTSKKFKNISYYNIDDPTTTNLLTADFEKGKTYYYRICTYKVIKGVVEFSDCSAYVVVNTTIEIDTTEFTGLNYVSEDQVVTLTWNKVENADGYYIEASPSQDFGEENLISQYIADKEITTCELNGFLVNKTYYFRVCAYLSDVIDEEEEYVFGKFSQLKSVDVVPFYTTPQALEEKTVNESTMISDITQKKYKLKFFDDFNGTQLNSSYWTFDKVNANGDGEEQAYTPKALVVRDSNAIITADKETVLYDKYGNENGPPVGKSYYTSAKFNSRNKVYYKYGRFEMYAKMPQGKGAWPAFWTLGQYKGWPWGGEIDILEMAGFDYGYVSAIHWCEPDEKSPAAYTSGHLSIGGIPSVLSDTRQVKLADAYHVIGMEWTPTKIHFYFDGKESGNLDITKSSMSYAMHNPHYMIINYALGGMGGTVDPSVFPQNMYVDWVKVWQTY